MRNSNETINRGINESMNYDDVFIRCVTAALLQTMQERIRWVNKFTSGDVEIVVPFYPQFVGQTRFLRDLFEDDIPDKRVELNTDPVPRAVIIFNSLTIKSGDAANPNVRVPHTGGTNKVQQSSRLKPLPIELSYSLKAKLKTNIDTYKFIQTAAEVFWLYNFFTFDYKGLKVDAIVTYPDNSSIEKQSELKIDTIDDKTIASELVVRTYLPVLTDTKIYNTGRIKTFDLSINTLKSSPNVVED